MATHADMIKSALRRIGVLATGETLDSDQQADGLSIFNKMLDSWSTEKLLIPAEVREEFSLTSNDASYTMGPSADFNTTRPVKINSAKIEVQDSPAYELPVEIIGAQEWAAIDNKELTAENPTKLYVEMTATTVTLKLWPVPTSANKLVLHSQKALTAVSTAQTTVTYPPGYEEALETNLCVRLAPEYGKQIDPVLFELARELKSNIKRQNFQPMLMTSDAFGLGQSRGGFSITEGS
jgi:hypothetical protein